MELEQLIQEAKSRGLVPGAVVKEAPYNRWPPRTLTIIDPPRYGGRENRLYCTSTTGISILIMADGVWATVVTPAPQEGLQEGDGVEASKKVLGAIADMAIELGLAKEKYRSSYEIQERGVTWMPDSVPHCPLQCGVLSMRNRLLPEEFIRRMRITAAKKEQEIRVDDYITIKLNRNEVYIHNKTSDVSMIIPNDTIRKIHQNLKDQ